MYYVLSIFIYLSVLCNTRRHSTHSSGLHTMARSGLVHGGAALSERLKVSRSKPKRQLLQYSCRNTLAQQAPGDNAPGIHLHHRYKGWIMLADKQLSTPAIFEAGNSKHLCGKKEQGAGRVSQGSPRFLQPQILATHMFTCLQTLLLSL